MKIGNSASFSCAAVGSHLTEIVWSYKDTPFKTNSTERTIGADNLTTTGTFQILLVPVLPLQY